jgi:hypothetical protein
MKGTPHRLLRIPIDAADQDRWALSSGLALYADGLKRRSISPVTLSTHVRNCIFICDLLKLIEVSASGDLQDAALRVS